MDENEISREKAMILFDRAYRHQMNQEFAVAIELYQKSIETFATAEAHTFLGWTYAMLNRYDEAIAECECAIEIDPEYGNPYNDIGSYLIELERWQEAIPWLEKAITAPRYEAPHYPHFNLGRVYEQLGQPQKALHCYQQALRIEPTFLAAEWAKNGLIGRLN